MTSYSFGLSIIPRGASPASGTMEWALKASRGVASGAFIESNRPKQRRGEMSKDTLQAPCGELKRSIKMVFVIDKHKKPLMPCSEKRARQLLEKGRATIHKMYPFTIRIKDRLACESKLSSLRLKIDPGSRTTGIAVLLEASPKKAKTVLLLEVKHKIGIKDSLDTRRALRRGRRNRKTRYRQPRFLNRRRKDGWLPPSLEARVNQTMNVVGKLIRLLPIAFISTEHIKFDTQLMQNSEVSGVKYQQGELFGYEIREYLLEKFQRKCAYCGIKDVPLEIEHFIPKNPKHGPKGTDRISNLALACNSCNTLKGNKQPGEWADELKTSAKAIDKRRLENISKVQEQIKKPLKDAAMMNATRWKLYNRLKETNLSVECGTGARTKKQRLEHGFSKEHYYDAACVGASTPKIIVLREKYVQVWSAFGRGTRRLCNTDKYGFPISHRSGQKQHFGFQTGDIVEANIPKGKYKGRWKGRVAVRSSGYFDIKDSTGKRLCQGVSCKYMKVLQRNNGWQYQKKRIAG